MGGVVHMNPGGPRHQKCECAALWSARLRESLAIVRAIDAGELFADQPASEEARQRHSAGAALLEVLSKQLEALVEDVEAAGAKKD